MVGLGAMLREQGRHEEGTKFLQEASGIVAAPAAETSMSMRAANNGAARPFARASSLTSYAFHRASSAEKITSIKDAGNLVRKNLKVLKMAKLFSGGVDGGGGWPPRWQREVAASLQKQRERSRLSQAARCWLLPKVVESKLVRKRACLSAREVHQIKSNPLQVPA